MALESILNLIPQTVDAQLVAKMQTEVPGDDTARAGLVRLGLLQEDPTDAGINILSYQNDRANPDKWVHSIASVGQSAGIKVPPFEIGGGEMWWRRFTTELIMFLPEEDIREEARVVAAMVMARAENAIRNTFMSRIVNGLTVSLIDSFKESAHEIFVVSSDVTEGGGESQFIWKGKIWWQVLTSKGR